MLTPKSLTSIYKIPKRFINTRSKLVTLSVFCFFNFSCGKKVENTVTEQDVRRPTLNTSFLELVASYSASSSQLSSKISSKKLSQDKSFSAIIEADAFIRIPEYLQVTQGNAGNQFARVYFELPGSYLFYCSYQGGASSTSPSTEEEIQRGLYYQLDDCYEDVNNDGEAEALGYYPGYEAAIDKSSQVTLEILGADPRFQSKVKAQLEVDWH